MNSRLRTNRLAAALAGALAPLAIASIANAADLPPFPALPVVLEDFRNLRTGSGIDAAGKEFVRDHLRLVFRSGTLSPVLTKSGRQAGFVFEGAGHYTYTAANPGDADSMSRNIASLGNAGAVRNGALDEEMTGCVVLSAAPLWAALSGSAAPPGGEGSAAANDRLATVLRGADEAAIGVDHLAAQTMYSSVAKGMLYAEIDGLTLDPGYLSDPASLGEERLILFRTVLGIHFGTVVSSQEIAGAEGQAALMLTRMEFSLSTDNNSDATVTIVETLSPRRPDGRLITFSLMNHRETAVESWQSKTRTLDVRSVRTADGRDLPFSHRYHGLLVELPEAPAADTLVTLRFELQYHFLKDKAGDQFFWLGGWPWYPEPHGDSAVDAVCRWNLRTKKPFRPIAPGLTLARRTEGDVEILVAETPVSTDFPVVFGGRFESKETVRDGVTVRVNVYGPKIPRAPEALTDGAFALLGAYGKMLSPYPYKEIDVVLIKSNDFWQSPAGLVLMSDDWLTTRFGTLQFRDALNQVYAHEFAHQWWGNLVTPRDFRYDNWISESIAEYVGTVVFAGTGADAKEQAERMQKTLDLWRGQARSSKRSVSIADAGGLRGSAADDYVDILYGRGPLVLHMLRTMMGNDAFFQMLRTIGTKYAGKTMTTDQFAQEASPFCGENMKWYFDQWIKQPGIPDVSVTKSVSNEGGKTILSGHLSQTGGGFKILMIPFIFDLPGGARSAKLVRMTTAEQDFRVELPAGASHVVVDPSNNNLVNYK